ncbi:hypothetical protein H2204_010294 [Knufia peltigerae]|uniref:NAD(P)-binding domain-containing protein n=1 Tax=Knufia peltigerae TaxID=1002370 RepID=A0AA39CV53_9EURO|nr:hypothetical protein H2204_010294 [Knufia peltigerae]
MGKHLLVLGATGPSGLDFCDAALESGHSLTVYARNPSKLPGRIAKNPNVAVIQGQFDDVEGLRNAASCGADACVSFLGPMIPSWGGSHLVDGYKILIPLLIEHDVQRALFLSTPSYVVAKDHWSLAWYLATGIVWLLFNSAWHDVVDCSEYVASQPTDKLRWTLFRLPNLKSGPAGPAKTAFRGDGNDGWNLDRKTLAIWVLNEIEQEKWVGEAPIVFNA